MKKPAIAAVVALAATAFAAHAQVKPEDHIKQRQAAYRVLGFNFASLGAMAQGKKPFDAQEAARNADLVAALSDYPQGHFTEGTDKGETKARAEIWQKRSDFDDKMKKMIAEAKKLPQAARAGEGALKKQFGDTASTCKACHDDYRAK